MTAIRVAVAGAAGRMGQETCRAVWAAADMDLTAALDVVHVGDSVGQLAGIEGCDLAIGANLPQTLEDVKPDVLVDFTQPYSRLSNFRAAVAGGARPVVGTTGWAPSDVAEGEAGLGAVIAPNFAIGAILMIEFAKAAARYLPDAEIVELHHSAKLDAPSGTAAMTARTIVEARRAAAATPTLSEGMADSEARGLDADGVRVHSVRLPGLLAHQEVIFGGLGQTLTLRHDSMSRESFMPGVLLACRKVMTLEGLVYGLENLLD